MFNLKLQLTNSFGANGIIRSCPSNIFSKFNCGGDGSASEDSCEISLYLDDIAKFMQETDFRPDLDPHNGNEQVIDVYTVGFTTSPFANAVLQKTATQGNGQFYFSTDPEQLATDIVSAVTDIMLGDPGRGTTRTPARWMFVVREPRTPMPGAV